MDENVGVSPEQDCISVKPGNKITTQKLRICSIKKGQKQVFFAVLPLFCQKKNDFNAF